MQRLYEERNVALVRRQQMNTLPLCPVHSYFRRRHPELREDIISRPQLISRPAGFYVINGCWHAAEIFGPHESQEAAEAAWVAIVEHLEAELSDEKKSDLAEYEARENRFGLAEEMDFSFPKSKLLR